MSLRCNVVSFWKLIKSKPIDKCTKLKYSVSEGFFHLIFRLNSGWSFHSSGPARKTGRKTDITVNEQEIIRNVLERADRIRQVEEERIGYVSDVYNKPN